MIHEIGVIFIVSAILALICKTLKQPMVPAYVLAGLVVGPLFLGWVNHPEAIAELSEVAIVILLFVIGADMDLGRLKKLGLVAVLGGFINTVTIFAIGFLLAKAFGLSNIAAAYIGVASSFSSTMLVVKILGDKYDLETLYGRIVVGILIMEDMLAIFALSILTTVDDFSFDLLLSTFTLAAGMILIIVFVVGKFVLPRLFNYIAHDRDVLFVVAMAILFLAANYAEYQKLSLGIGSFLAGLAISRLAYRFEISGDLKAIKFFFTVLFFASLGLQLTPEALFIENADGYTKLITFYETISQHALFITAFFFLAVAVKPVIAMLLVVIFGYKRSEAFNVGLSLGQSSEFGLILVLQGVTLGHLDHNLFPPVIIATVMSMTLSSYLLKFSPTIYRALGDKFKWIEKIRVVKRAELNFEPGAGNDFEIVLVGRDCLGTVIDHALRKIGKKYVVIDSNPYVINKLMKSGVSCIFGDITNHEVLEQLDFKKIKTVFSTSPDNRDNELLISYMKEVNPEANFIGIVNSRKKAEELYGSGAHYVLVTYLLAGFQLISSRDKDGVNLGSLLGGSEQVRELGKKQREVLFDDPAGAHTE